MVQARKFSRNSPGESASFLEHMINYLLSSTVHEDGFRFFIQDDQTSVHDEVVQILVS